MTRRIALITIVAGALLLTGCTASSGGSDSAGAPEPGMTVEESRGGSVDMNEAADGGAMLAEGEMVAADAPAGVQQSVITTGYLSVTVDSPIDAADEAAGIATGLGGRVESRSESPANEYQSEQSSLTLRIPTDRYDDAVDGLRDLGDVTSYWTNDADVTQQRTDLTARVDVLEASVDRLTALLGEAETTADLIAIESELTVRQAELDSLTQQLDLLVDQVDYSTLSVDLVTEELAPAAGPTDFWGGVVAGWNALVSFGGALVIALGVLLPWIIVLAVVGGIVLALVLGIVRRGHGRSGGTGDDDADTSGAATPAPESQA